MIGEQKYVWTRSRINHPRLEHKSAVAGAPTPQDRVFVEEMPSPRDEDCPIPLDDGIYANLPKDQAALLVELNNTRWRAGLAPRDIDGTELLVEVV